MPSSIDESVNSDVNVDKKIMCFKRRIENCLINLREAYKDIKDKNGDNINGTGFSKGINSEYQKEFCSITKELNALYQETKDKRYLHAKYEANRRYSNIIFSINPCTGYGNNNGYRIKKH
jgi:hypothetical protein